MSETPPSSAPIRKNPWVRGICIVVGLLLLVGVCIEGYRRIDRYAKQTVVQHAQQLPVAIQLKDTPKWLDPVILNDILQTSVDLARRDEATFQRFQNPLDKAILDEIPAQYAVHLNERSNAWLKQIHRIVRVTDANQQRIEIYADYRKPVAWVAVAYLPNGGRITGPKALGDFAQCRDRQVVRRYYLVDEDMVRLPGEYAEADRTAIDAEADRTGISRLMAIYGVDEIVPLPGAAWSVPELAAGLKLAGTLKGQPYLPQIGAINVANYSGRIDVRMPHLLLETVWRTQDKLPRLIIWGRPVGETSFYEVSTDTKIRSLQNLFARFNRIDAGRDYVDIRTEQIRVPKLAAQIDTPEKLPVQS